MIGGLLQSIADWLKALLIEGRQEAASWKIAASV